MKKKHLILLLLGFWLVCNACRKTGNANQQSNLNNALNPTAANDSLPKKDSLLAAPNPFGQGQTAAKDTSSSGLQPGGQTNNGGGLKPGGTTGNNGGLQQNPALPKTPDNGNGLIPGGGPASPPSGADNGLIPGGAKKGKSGGLTPNGRQARVRQPTAPAEYETTNSNVATQWATIVENESQNAGKKVANLVNPRFKDPVLRDAATALLFVHRSLLNENKAEAERYMVRFEGAQARAPKECGEMLAISQQKSAQFNRWYDGRMAAKVRAANPAKKSAPKKGKKKNWDESNPRTTIWVLQR